MRVFDGKTMLALAGAVGFTVAGFAAPAVAAADGEKLFKRCSACHTLLEGKNKVGPSLADILGRKSGTAPGYKYSVLNKAAGDAGLVWTSENIVAYLPDPTAFLTEYLKANGMADKAKGRSKMSFKMPRQADREAIAAYLAAQAK